VSDYENRDFIRHRKEFQMNQMTEAKALAFVKAIKLPERAKKLVEKKAARINFDEMKNQAVVVGSEVVSFVKGISAERKQDIINAAMLAQLAANEKVKDRSNIFAWYNAYFNVLSNIGWVIQETGFNSYEEEADGLEAHEAILKVAAVVLAAAPTALAIVTATVEAMKSMDKNNPWITIFDRESRSEHAARFQISLAEQDEAGQFMVSTMAFGLKAESTITQILFFKIWKNHMTLKHCSGKVTINTDLLGAVRDKIKAKLVDWAVDLIGSTDIITPAIKHDH
jgi:hypothetical protein